MTILHDYGDVLGRPLDTCFWALTITWSWLLACVWSGPKLSNDKCPWRFLVIIGQVPSLSKSNRLNLDISRVILY